ncbi:Crp/Fnr family transcriptional regulator [Chloroflexota bacterium]
MVSEKKPKMTPFDSGSQLMRDTTMFNEVDIFKGIAPAELKALFNAMELKTCPVETVLFRPEDATERLYILLKGQVEQYLLTSNGKRLVTRRIKPGSVFGIMGLLGQTMMGNFAETTEDSTVYIATRKDIIMLLKRQPGVALNILEVVGNRLRILEELLVKSVYSPVNIRLADFLLTNADPASGILFNITHEEIGDTIGAARQTVTEALSRMRKQGLILTGSKQVRIIDRHGLEKIVQDQQQ